MKRRQLILLSGATIGLGSALGTGAFSSVTAERTATINVAEDSTAYLRLDAKNSSTDIVYQNDENEIQIELDKVNANAITTIENAFEIQNLGTQHICLSVSVSTGDDLSEDDIDDVLQFTLTDFDNEPNLLTDGPFEMESLSAGEDAAQNESSVTIRIDTTEYSAGSELVNGITFSAEAGSCSVDEEPEQPDTKHVYGTGFDDELYKIEISDNPGITATSLGELEGNDEVDTTPNAVSYDAGNKRMYYTVDDSNDGRSKLWFFNKDSDNKPANSDGKRLNGDRVVGSSWYEDEYYYIPNHDDTVYKVGFNIDGTVDENTKIDEFEEFNDGDSYTFGDIAIDSEGMLYASTTEGDFFSLNLESSDGEFKDDYGDGAGNLQLGFSGEEGDQTLYGHDAGDGEFYEITIDGGNITTQPLGKVEGGDGTLKFTDLANGIPPMTDIDEVIDAPPTE
ncbi:hypothetical protein [Natronocalculus amylovorans]|uniref:Uncharacterized protein n=1 Tax=Natronocalculus amylovorans TaxID=2917812 RepID=A0AAE3FWQ7_9EURY|nr:hypothetical protein [Natronocalculus amylovorans]MCL9816992.1 hypothetical protein [Natronocalculus amylovorans]